MNRILIILFFSVLTLAVRGQGRSDSSNTTTGQDTVPAKKLSPAQQKMLEAKQKRDADAAKRKAAMEQRKQESEQKRQQMMEQRKGASEQRKQGAGIKKTTDSSASSQDSSTPKKLSPAEQRAFEMKQKRDAEAAKRKEASDQRKAEAEKRRQDMMAKKPGAGKPKTGTDSTAGKDSTANLSATQKKAQEMKEKRDAEAAKRKESLEQRKIEADKHKQEMQEQKEAASQKKQETPKKPTGATGGASKSESGQPAKKSYEEKVKEKKESEAANPKAKPAHGQNKGKEGPATVQESQAQVLYYTLPIEALPQLRNYIEDKEDQDSKDLRKGFVLKQDAERGFLQLQRPAELDKFTRIQLYNTKENKQLMAIETSNCTPDCNNQLHFYMRDGEGWKDVTDQYMPQFDKKYILSKVKARYKKQYLDNEVYNAKGYETSEEFYKTAIVSDISPDANKIIVRDQYIDYPIYEMIWNQAKNKFDLNKL